MFWLLSREIYNSLYNFIDKNNWRWYIVVVIFYDFAFCVCEAPVQLSHDSTRLTMPASRSWAGALAKRETCAKVYFI